jgi:translation initiation factor 5B
LNSTSLEKEHKSVDLVKKTAVGGGIAVKIERAPWEPAKMFGRQWAYTRDLHDQYTDVSFTLEDEVVSLISRKSIDTLKNVFRDQVTKDEWLMIRKMKDEQGIP